MASVNYENNNSTRDACITADIFIHFHPFSPPSFTHFNKEVLFCQFLSFGTLYTIFYTFMGHFFGNLFLWTQFYGTLFGTLFYTLIGTLFVYHI